MGQFSETLITWYHKHKRDLPWRRTQNPYAIWVSEIILQQTRVDQGKAYYIKFLKRFPTVKDLAEAEEQEVLRLWQGLGYYSRARNMHFAAKQIMTQHSGHFPTTHDEIKKLKGVGEYTAAAISSFAFHLPHPVNDGNVKRVIARYFGIEDAIDESKGLNAIASKLDEVFDPEQSHDFNQAIMEIGALQCVPSSPNCTICPFTESCIAFKTNKVNVIPAKKKKIQKKERFLHYFVLEYNGSLILNKRISKGIWQNMFDFPSVELENDANDIDINALKKASKVDGSNIRVTGQSDWKKHILTHQIIYAKFHSYTIDHPEEFMDENSQLVAKEDVGNYPLPKLIDNYLIAP